MKNKIDIVKEIADSMAAVSELLTNKEFYEEFNTRLKRALNIFEANNSNYEGPIENTMKEIRRLTM